MFEWLLDETYDDKGNHMFYEHVQEDSSLKILTSHHNNRNYAQAYVRRILKGNTTDAFDDNLQIGQKRMGTDHVDPLTTFERHSLFEVLFDFDDITWPTETLPSYAESPASPSIPHELSIQAANKIPAEWPIRPDPFSSFRSGFEIRTLRLCRRVLILHHLNEGDLVDAPLVKSTDCDFQNNENTQLSFLTLVYLSGYRKDSNDPQRYLTKRMPPFTFKYPSFEPQIQQHQSMTAARGDYSPRALNSEAFSLVDVFGDAMIDIVEASEKGFWFWQNLGQGHRNGRRR